MEELLPKTFLQIVSQIDNLRSNNSKEALTLTWEFLEYQNIEKVQQEIISSLVAGLFGKSCCEKAFLKNQALNGINVIPKKYNPYILHELNGLTQSNNGTIAELAIKSRNGKAVLLTVPAAGLVLFE